MLCPRCNVTDPGNELCPQCGMKLDYFRCRVYSSIVRFPPGQPITQDFAVVEKIGEGPTGITFKVQDLTSGDVYALKFVTVDEMCQEEGVRRFIKRCARLAALEHPGIARLRDVRETEFGFVAVITEFLEGENLGRLLARQKRFTLDESLTLAKEIGDALTHAHGEGVLHRNLRPSNVILTLDGHAKLIDFAIPAVRPIGSRSPILPYVAPEVVQDPDAIDQCADIYSFGKLIIHLLSGQIPVRPTVDRLPRNLSSILLKATADNPQERYDSVEELLPDLANALSPASAEEIPEVPAPPAPRPAAVQPARGAETTAFSGQPFEPKERPLIAPVGVKTEIRLPVKRVPPPIPEPMDGGGGKAFQVVEAGHPTMAAEEGSKPDHSFRGHKGYVHTVAIHPDGTKFASGASDSSIRIWAVGQAESTHILTGHRGYVYSVGFLRGGSHLVSAGMDGNLRIWNLQSPEEVEVIQAHQDRIFAMCIHPSQSKLFTAGMDGKINIWKWDELGQDGELPGHSERIYAMAISRDGRWLASGGMDKVVKVWDIEARKEAVVLKGHTDRIYAVAISPDGAIVYSGGMDEGIRVWDRAGGKQMGLIKGHAGHIYCLAISPDGRLLVSGSMDRSLRIWDARRGTPVRTIQDHEGTVSTIAVGAGMLVSGSYDSVVRVWKMPELSTVGV